MYKVENSKVETEVAFLRLLCLYISSITALFSIPPKNPYHMLLNASIFLKKKKNGFFGVKYPNSINAMSTTLNAKLC